MGRKEDDAIEKEIEEEYEDDGEPKREKWNRPIDFVLACIGFSVGLGNVWRFPYLCYKNGGAIFLIPYGICVVLIGIPMFYLEVSLGQFMQRSGIKAWRIVPLFQGVGLCTVFIVFFLDCYYNIILCWAFYYFFSSLNTHLVWGNCNNWWNTYRCTESGQFANNASFDSIDTNKSTIAFINGTEIKGVDSVTEFWENKVLGIDGSTGIDDLGTVKWDLALCNLFAWLVVYICICKGIKTSGKVMYVTATSPYLFMIILLVRGVTLEGSLKGLQFYMIPRDWNKLWDMKVWVDAGSQVFFSMSLCLGTLPALGSFNKFKHNSFRDSLIFAFANSGTSILAGVVVFSVLGFMAHEQGVDIADVVEAGPGLVFIAYPKALSKMPIAPLWSVFFFIMVILLGLDSQFVGVEGFVAAITDIWPNLREGIKRYVFVGSVCAVMYLVGLTMVTNGGMYVLQLFDHYPCSRFLFLVGLVECLVLTWVYGACKYYDHIELMYDTMNAVYLIGRYFYVVCWSLITPLICVVMFILSMISYSELSYTRPSAGTYQYPQWAVWTGWGMAFFTIAFIPLTAFYIIVVKIGCGNWTWKDSITPIGLKSFQLLPGENYIDPEARDKTPANRTNVADYDNPGYSNDEVNNRQRATYDHNVL